MALIKCPECFKEISDKVKVCPFCGYPFESSDDAKDDFQKVEISSVNIRPQDLAKPKKILYAIIAVVITLAIGISGFFVIKNNMEKNELINEFNSYIDNLNLITIAMVVGGSDAEGLCNLTANVWHNSIYEERDPDTDMFTMRNGISFYDDFNIALGILYSNIDTKQTISDIESNQELVEAIMRELQNPPTGLEYCYETVTELYIAYNGLTNLAISPTGSLDTYTEIKTEKIDNFLELFDKLKLQIPDKSPTY